MIKLKEIAEGIIKEGGKAFGTRAKRMTTTEMNAVFEEIKKKIGSYFSKFEMNRSLSSKADHGDLDIKKFPTGKAWKDNKSNKTTLERPIWRRYRFTIRRNNVESYTRLFRYSVI